MNNIKEQIRAEIKRLYDGEAPKHDQQCDFDDGYFTGIAAISKFLDSLPEEKSSEDLEDEIATWIPAHINGLDRDEWKDRNKTVYITLSAIIGWSGCIARHFAKWGAEHQVIDGNKMIEPSKDLEQAAMRYAIPAYMKDVDENYLHEYPRDPIKEEAFIAGAKWMAKHLNK